MTPGLLKTDRCKVHGLSKDDQCAAGTEQTPGSIAKFFARGHP